MASPGSDERREIATPSGLARAAVRRPAGPATGLVVLGHAAGGGIDAADLVAVTAALLDAGWAVARVEQPYRVQGRRLPDRAPVLDAAWSCVVAALRADHPGPLVVGGRSSGARVACRTAAAVGASAVVCLAFPLQPPPGKSGRQPPSRVEELRAVQVPVLVVQGERDRFGGPAAFPPQLYVVAVPGDHSLRRTAPVAAAVLDWIGAQRLA